MSCIINFFHRHRHTGQRLLWFVGLYLASLIGIGTLYYAGHYLITLLP